MRHRGSANLRVSYAFGSGRVPAEVDPTRICELPVGLPDVNVLGSERPTGATLDRLTHRCRIIATKGDSYRLHDAKTRTRRAAQTTPVAVTTLASQLAEVLSSSTGARSNFRQAFTSHRGPVSAGERRITVTALARSEPDLEQLAQALLTIAEGAPGEVVDDN